MKLSAKLKALLKRTGKLSLRMSAKVTDPSGTRRTVRNIVAPKLAGKRKGCARK
jgi:hypothetical protein